MWPNLITLALMIGNLRNVRARCESDRNCFCYFCSGYIKSKQKKYAITSTVKKLAEKCFPDYTWPGLKSDWAPDSCCARCYQNMNRHCDGNAKLIYSMPTIWRRPNSNHSDCFFCTTELNKHNRVHESSISLSTVSCITRPLLAVERTEPDNDVVEPSNDEAGPSNYVLDLETSFDLPELAHDESFHTSKYHKTNK